jgi:hypothetical protein
MCQVTEELLETGNCLKLIQQCGSGLEGVDILKFSFVYQQGGISKENRLAGM